MSGLSCPNRSQKTAELRAFSTLPLILRILRRVRPPRRDLAISWALLYCEASMRSRRVAIGATRKGKPMRYETSAVKTSSRPHGTILPKRSIADASAARRRRPCVFSSWILQTIESGQRTYSGSLSTFEGVDLALINSEGARGMWLALAERPRNAWLRRKCIPGFHISGAAASG